MKCKATKVFYSVVTGRVNEGQELEIDADKAKPIVDGGFLLPLEQEAKPKTEEKLETKPLKKAKKSTKKAK